MLFNIFSEEISGRLLLITEYKWSKQRSGVRLMPFLEMSIVLTDEFDYVGLNLRKFAEIILRFHRKGLSLRQDSMASLLRIGF